MLYTFSLLKHDVTFVSRSTRFTIRSLPHAVSFLAALQGPQLAAVMLQRSEREREKSQNVKWVCVYTDQDHWKRYEQYICKQQLCLGNKITSRSADTLSWCKMGLPSDFRTFLCFHNAPKSGTTPKAFRKSLQIVTALPCAPDKATSSGAVLKNEKADETV